MKRFMGFIFLTAMLCAGEKEQVAQISEAMGHLIGKNLQALGLELDIQAIVKGLQDEASGKNSPISDEECLQALSDLQEAAQSKMAEANLQEAESFLKKNRNNPNIVSLQDGKVQYEKLQPGNGPAIHSYDAPLVRYSGSTLSGIAIPATEEIIDLDNAILGLKEVLVGMKGGEKRKVYIHPEFGYGENSSENPNALLIFELEVIKADASMEAHAASSVPESVQ